MGLRLPLVLFAALVLHQSLFVAVRVGDVQPQVMLLVAVAAGLVAGSERGALVGFAAGLLADLLVHTPLGLSALAFSLVGFAVGGFQAGIIRSAWWIAPATALFATAAGMLLYGLLGALIGQSHFVSPRLAVVALGAAAMNAVLAPPVVKAVGWAMDGTEGALAR
jgi:rod shape-determining protein MreD